MFVQEHRYYRSLDYGALKLYEKQISDLTKSIRIYPKIGKVFAERASAYEKLGKFQIAAKDRQMAKKISH